MRAFRTEPHGRRARRHSVNVTARAGAFGLALLCAVASGCAGSESGSAAKAPRSSSAAATSPVLSATGGADVAYPTAQMAGRLMLREGCLALDGEPILWPSGTEWDDANQVVVLPDDVRLKVGTRVRVGGGQVPASVASTYNEAAQDGIDACTGLLGAKSMALVSGSL